MKDCVQSERREDKSLIELKGSVLQGNRIEVATRQKVQAELCSRRTARAACGT
jgi:hypothetical protein